MYSSCNAKVVESGEAIVVCGKCDSKMKALKCAKKGVAHVIVEDTLKQEHKVTVFSEVVDSIVNYANLMNT